MATRPCLSIGVALAALTTVSGCGESPPLSSSYDGACLLEAQDVTRMQPFCGKTSWTAGITEICDGRLVYRDYVYDDYGADTPTPDPYFGPSAASSFTAGDQHYPAGAENTADLVNLELWLDGDIVRVAFEINSLYEAGQTIAAIAIDTDGNLETGGGAWPGLGISSDGWEVLHRFEDGNPTTNRITGSFERPEGSAWRLWAVVAQADGTVMNVAFRGLAEITGGTTGSAWFEQRQAEALAAGDITQFSEKICVSDLAGALTRGAAGPEHGFHERVFTSAYTLPPGEGVSIEGIPGQKSMGGQLFNFFGKYQPYAYFLPDTPGPHDVQLNLHGSTANHTHFIEQPGFQGAFGVGLDRLIVSPLGRGLDGAFSDISERDVLEALDDALAYFDTNADRIVVSGYSMGGYGAVRFAELYPDRFMGLVALVAATGDSEANPRASGGLVGSIIDFVRNLRYLPSTHWYGGADALVPAPEGLAMRDAMAAESPGVYDFFFHPDADHSTPQGVDMWDKEAAISATWNPLNPSRVTFRMDEFLDYPDYGIKHDRAYWVSSIRARDEGFADVDLESLGCGHASPVLEEGQDAGVGPAHYAWERTYRHRVGEVPRAPQMRLVGTLANVASLTLDREGACLPGNFAYEIETDGSVTIGLGDGQALTLNGAGVHTGNI